MINRLAWRVQPLEQIRKRKQRRREMWQRHEEFAEFVRKARKKREDMDRDTREHTGTDDK